jgi:hypothetical protein
MDYKQDASAHTADCQIKGSENSMPNPQDGQLCNPEAPVNKLSNDSSSHPSMIKKEQAVPTKKSVNHN